MILAMLALLVGAPPAPDLPPPTMTITARQLHDSCARYVAEAGAETQSAEAVTCAVEMVTQQAVSMLETAADQGKPETNTRRYCPPEAVLRREDASFMLAQVYLAYFARNPAVQDEADGGAVLQRALADKWPCRR